MTKGRIFAGVLGTCFSLLLGACGKGPSSEVNLLNASYDPTRELYEDINAAFAKHWKQTTGQDVRINQSHGGSGRQARAVIDGLPADVVTLALAGDIDKIALEGQAAAPQLGTASAAQQRSLRLHHRAARARRQPEEDSRLGRPGARRRAGDHAEPQDFRRRALELSRRLGMGRATARRNDASAREFVRKLYKNVPVLDTGARGSLTTFAQRALATSPSPGRTKRIWRCANAAAHNSKSSCRRSACSPNLR
jgi:sulfate transport system substrate-binding protein